MKFDVEIFKESILIKNHDFFNHAKLNFKSKINFKNPRERNRILGDRKIEGNGTGNDSERLAVNSCSTNLQYTN